MEPQKKEEKKGSLWIPLGVALLVILGPLGVVLLVVASLGYLVWKQVGQAAHTAEKPQGFHPPKINGKEFHVKQIPFFQQFETEDAPPEGKYVPRDTTPARDYRRPVDTRYYSSAGLPPEKQLQQIDTLLEAGLLTREEHKERKQRILAER